MHALFHHADARTRTDEGGHSFSLDDGESWTFSRSNAYTANFTFADGSRARFKRVQRPQHAAPALATRPVSILSNSAGEEEETKQRNATFQARRFRVSSSASASASAFVPLPLLLLLLLLLLPRSIDHAHARESSRAKAQAHARCRRHSNAARPRRRGRHARAGAPSPRERERERERERDPAMLLCFIGDICLCFQAAFILRDQEEISILNPGRRALVGCAGPTGIPTSAAWNPAPRDPVTALSHSPSP